MGISKTFFIDNPSTICTTNNPYSIINHSTIISPELLEKINSFNFAGAYQISSNILNIILYVGTSVNIFKRIQQHISGIVQDGEYSNFQLREHCKKFGIDDLDFDVLEKLENGDSNDLNLLEREYSEKLEPLFNRNNNRPIYLYNKKYTNDYEPTDYYVNDKILNEFGNPIVTRKSINFAYGIVKRRKIQPLDPRYEGWTPTYILFDENGEITRIRGDVTNLPKVKKFHSDTEVTEITIVRRNMGFIGR